MYYNTNHNTLRNLDVIAHSGPVDGGARQAPQNPQSEHLPFTIKAIRTHGALAKAVQLRQQAYGRHVPELARKLGAPETYDEEPGTLVLLAESKLDGEPVGTMRIQTNLYQPLHLEKSITLPNWLRDRSLAEATRLGVARGHTGTMAKMALFKAFYLYCLHADIDWMVITARAPLDRQYENLLFADVLEDKAYVPMRHIGDIPHRVLALDVTAAHSRWQQAAHPLLKFMTQTQHPDIQITDALPPVTGVPALRTDPIRELSALRL